MAEADGIREVISELLPEAKVDRLIELVSTYSPLLLTIKQLADNGDAKAVEMLANPRVVSQLGEFMHCFIENSRDFGNMSNEELVDSWKNTGMLLYYLIDPSLGKEGMPESSTITDFVQTQLEKIHLSELFALLNNELQKRASKYPELEHTLEYRKGKSAEVGQYEAQEYLQGLSCEGRANRARNYGLYALAELEKAIEEAMGMLIPSAEELGIDEYFKRLPEFNRIRYEVSHKFPELERRLATSLCERLSLSPEEGTILVNQVEKECNLLVKLTAIRLFNYPEEGKPPPIIDQAVKGTWNALAKILMARGLFLRGYYQPLLEDESDLEKLKSWAEKGDASQEGRLKLIEEMDKWAIRKEAFEIIIVGLEGKLGKDYGDAARRGMDAWRKREERRKGKEVPQSAHELALEKEAITRWHASEEEREGTQTLNAIIEKAMLRPRQQMVIDLTLKGKSDREIALALEKEFGKPTSDGNVRKLRCEARQRMRAVKE